MSDPGVAESTVCQWCKQPIEQCTFFGEKGRWKVAVSPTMGWLTCDESPDHRHAPAEPVAPVEVEDQEPPTPDMLDQLVHSSAFLSDAPRAHLVAAIEYLSTRESEKTVLAPEPSGVVEQPEVPTPRNTHCDDPRCGLPHSYCPSCGRPGRWEGWSREQWDGLAPPPGTEPAEPVVQPVDDPRAADAEKAIDRALYEPNYNPRTILTALADAGFQVASPDDPRPMDLVRELRETVGLFAGAMPITPKAAWEEALAKVAQLREGACWRCAEQAAPLADPRPTREAARRRLTEWWYNDPETAGQRPVASLLDILIELGALRVASESHPARLVRDLPPKSTGALPCRSTAPAVVDRGVDCKHCGAGPFGRRGLLLHIRKRHTA